MSKNLIILTIGAGIGGIGTYLYLKRKYDEILQEEIASVKEVFSKRDINIDSKKIAKIAKAAMTKPDIIDYSATIDSLAYRGCPGGAPGASGMIKEEDTEETTVNDLAYIPPYEVGSDEEYDAIVLTYYSDGYLVDENNELVENVDDTVGVNFAENFGEYDEDLMYVRNDRLKCYFEVQLDSREYTQIQHSIAMRTIEDHD
jgi:hypothetical protein